MSDSRKMDLSLEYIKAICNPYLHITSEIAKKFINRQLEIQFELPIIATDKTVLVRRLLMAFVRSHHETLGDFINDEKFNSFMSTPIYYREKVSFFGYSEDKNEDEEKQTLTIFLNDGPMIKSGM